MVIYKYKAEEHKGDQHFEMVWNCIIQWGRVSNDDYQSYREIMNIKTRRYDYERGSFVTSSYHFNLNKW